MDKILLNDDFIDFVNSQTANCGKVLRKIGEYEKYNSLYSQMSVLIDKIDDTNAKRLFDKITDCLENMSSYEKAYAFYLGMEESFNMIQLVNSEQ